MRRARRTRENPKGSDATTVILWVTLVGALIGVGYGLKYMTEAQRKNVLGV